MVRNEIANTVTHGIGLALSIAGVVLLLLLAISKGDARHIASFAVFGACLVATYAISTIYHSAKSRRRKLRLRMLDHCAIFLLIAGSYTPFMIVVVDNGFGRSLLALVWLMAIAGIAGKVFVTHKASRSSTLIYIAMGWLAVLVIVPLYKGLGWQGFLLLVAGGLAYTGGTYFFARDHRPYYHAIWHLFVLGGSALHFAAVALLLLPHV
ncbi:MAG: hemolysin III family protein [Verrucomicrobiae bacterium]|nr:hemolysin III family protein [Verrucomicrobiae bacterium]